MNGNKKLVTEFIDEISESTRSQGQGIPPKIIACFPFPYLPSLSSCANSADFENTDIISLGAQDCSSEERGAFTGDVSANMLRDIGCDYVILGHCERRKYHKESDSTILAKALSAIKNNITPIICIGESSPCKFDIEIQQQITSSIPSDGKIIIAYEPVWAVGAPYEAVSSGHISRAISYIKSCIHPAEDRCLGVLYGGAANTINALQIMASGADGLMLGRAGMNAKEVLDIAQICSSNQKN